MKIKTRKLIAAITATALLGSALGVGTYAITKSNNDFGFKGTYNLNAFAATADAQTKTVAGVEIDTTSALCLTSDIDNNGTVDYTLFVSIVDTADMSALSNIKVGYSIGGKYYNGTTEGLSNVVYSSLTVNSTEGGTATVTAVELATNYTKITSPKLIITEVAGPAEGAGIEIQSNTVALHNFTESGINSSFFTISGNLSTSKGKAEYKGLTLTQCLKMESSTTIGFTLSEAATVKLVFGSADTNKGVLIDGTKYTTGNDGIVSANLSAGAHTITKGDSINLFYIDVVASGSGETGGGEGGTENPGSGEAGGGETGTETPGDETPSTQTVTFSAYNGQKPIVNNTYGFLKLETLGSTSFSSSGMVTKNSVFSFTITKVNTIFKYVSFSDNKGRTFTIKQGGTTIGTYMSVGQEITLANTGDYTIVFGSSECKVTSITLS